MKRVANALLAYVERNPNAADSLDSIGRLWLAQDEPFSRDDLSRALDRIIADGCIEKHVSPDGHCLFRKRNAV